MSPLPPTEYFWMSTAIVEMEDGNATRGNEVSGVYIAEPNEGTTADHFLNIRRQAVKKTRELPGVKSVGQLLITKLERIG